jgi:type IX secretion system PorP/SprF family membrane protein
MKRIIFILASCIALQSTAQDVHFTQYYTSPLTLNPANTGLVNCDWRVAANYRNQWSSVNSVPYMTGSVSYDMATLRGKLNGGSLGLGVLGYFDRAGTGALQQVTAGLSAAYHLPLGGAEEFKPSTLSIGVQGYLVQKSLDFTKLKFEKMYDPVTGQLLYDSGENASNADLTYPDLNAGIMYSGYINTKTSLYGGVSMYHITRPVETFLNGTNKIHSRVSATLGSSIQMNDNMIVYLSSLYQQQGKATELLVGGAAGFILNPQHEEDEKSTVFYIGTWYRYGDAISPYIGFEFAKAKIGLTYDVNLSSFATATKGQGGLELSLIYNGCIIKNDTRTFNFACPRF